jgi:hypothetical protein
MILWLDDLIMYIVYRWHIDISGPSLLITSCVHEQKAYGLHVLCIEYALSIGMATVTVANKKALFVMLVDCVDRFEAL